MDRRLRQILAQPHEFAGGISILTFGDFAQLPPVMDRPLYATKQHPNALVREGQALYQSFDWSITLDVVHRQSGDDPIQVAFRETLMNLRTYSITEDDYNILKSRIWMNLSQAERNEFSLAIHLLPTRADVQAHNMDALSAMGAPVLKCLAEHHGPGAKDVSEEDAEGLVKVVYLCEGARVMLTRNIWTVNGK